MLIDLRRYRRARLTEAQKDFLQRFVPFARLIQNQTLEKCDLSRIVTTHGICASLILSEAIIKSNWGLHEVAVRGDNLCLLQKAEYWRGKSIDFEGRSYRSYSSWLDFSIDYSDEVTFFEKSKFANLLMANNLDEQIQIFAEMNPEILDCHGRIEGIIESYGLWEFDY